MIRSLILGGFVALGVVVAPSVHAVASVPAVAPSSKAMPQVVAPFPMSAGCYYANCTQARQAGETDIPEGSAHYCSKLDRDGDGIACES